MKHISTRLMCAGLILVLMTTVVPSALASETKATSPDISPLPIRPIAIQGAATDTPLSDALAQCCECGTLEGIPLYTLGNVTEHELRHYRREAHSLPDALFGSGLAGIIVTDYDLSDVYKKLRNPVMLLRGVIDYENRLVWANTYWLDGQVLTHELTHAWDYFVCGSLSDTDEFKQIYKAEGMNEYVCDGIAYPAHEYLANASERYFLNRKRLKKAAPLTCAFFDKHFRE